MIELPVSEALQFQSTRPSRGETVGFRGTPSPKLFQSTRPSRGET